jgi:hypothetical protein
MIAAALFVVFDHLMNPACLTMAEFSFHHIALAFGHPNNYKPLWNAGQV